MSSETQQPVSIGSEGGNGLIRTADELIQNELNVVMNILEDNMDKMPEGDYLRGMNALGALHKHKRDALRERRPGEILRCWMSLEEIEETDEDLYDEIMGVADDIVVELCGEDTTIYTDDEYNMLERGQEHDVFQKLLKYKPQEGNVGYETSPMVLHHAIQVIMARLFDDTYHELEVVRPVSCPCGWRGAQGNWDRHISNMRHRRWTDAELERRQPGIVYIDELHSTPETQVATQEVVAAAEAAGDQVVITSASGERIWIV